MPTLMQRAKAAVEVFRYGFDSRTGFRQVPVSQEKNLPIAWPDYTAGKPQWHMVDIESYLNEGFSLNSLVYSAIMYKVRATITAPLRAYTGPEDDPQLLPKDHPLAYLLAHPNEYQSWPEFHARNTVFLNLAGNVYIYVDPSTQQMYSLRPDRVFIIPSEGKPAGLKGYAYVPEGKSVTNEDDILPILPEDMMHISLPNPTDNLEGWGEGMSPLQPAAQSVDVDNVVTTFLNMFFNQGAMVTGILSYDIPLKEPVVDEIISRWNKKYGGYKKWGIGVLDRGGSYQRVSLTFEEMGFGEVDARSECRILGPFGIAPILVGAKVGLERSTYSNYEAARQAVWEDTLIPELSWFEIEYQNRFNDGEIFVQFDYSRVPAIQRALARQVSAAYTLVQMRMPPNQALQAVGIRTNKFEGGDESVELSGPGVQQGPRANPDNEDWGMREDAPK